MPAPKGHAPYNTKGEGGRPVTWTDEKIEQMAEEFEQWLKYPNSLFYKDFCLEKFINPDVMVYWAQRNDRFARALEYSKHIQESRLKKGAIFKNYDVGFTKFLLVNNHGAKPYSDKTESKVTTSEESADAFIMDRIKSSKDLVDGISTDD